MKDYSEGRLSEIKNKDGNIIYNVLVPATLSLPDKNNYIPVDFMVDTGSDKSMISYNFGYELGLDPPSVSDIIHSAWSADEREIHYIMRKVDLQIGSISKKSISICWCLAPRVHLNFLGMDFLHDYKFIINGRTKKFYITRHNVCVRCKG